MIYVVGRIAPDFRTYFQENGIPYGQFAPEPFIDSSTPHAFALNFSSVDLLTSSLRTLPAHPGVSGVITTGYEDYVVPASIIADYFQVPGIPIDAAKAATDKSLMRALFTAHDPTITPGFAPVQSWEDVERFMDEYPFPLMLKPSNLMKSLLITKNNTREEIRRNYEVMRTTLSGMQQGRLPVDTQIVVEEFMGGTMHTVAGFADHTGTVILLDDIVDCMTAADVGKHDMHLFSRQLPSTLPDDKKQALKRVARSGVAALGLKNTPIHAELILTGATPKIIEIGARMGGYRPRMFQLARGIDMYQAAINTATGKALDLSTHRHSACTVLEIFADTEGTFAEATNVPELMELASYQSSKMKCVKGDATGRASAGFRAPLTVVLAHDDPEQVIRDREWTRRNVDIRLQAI